MKALTFHQPYAGLLALGVKHYETRSWSTTYRGEVAIHAAVRPIDMAGFKAIAYVPAGLRDGSWGLVRAVGVVIAIAELVDVVQTHELADTIPQLERKLGGWGPGRFAWRFERRRLVGPFVAVGARRLWEWEAPASLLEAARA